jgi:hypothetical protein
MAQLTRLKGKAKRRPAKPKYYCIPCNKYFSTSLHAMERHSESHREGRMIKTYRIKGSNKFRPEEHIWNSTTRKFSPGPDTTLASVTPPVGMYDGEKEDLLRCRQCRRKTATYREDMELGSKSAILTKLLKHEEFCISSAAKKEN